MLLHIWSKMLSSSQNVLIKLSKTTSPQKLFPTDCITLYTGEELFYMRKGNMELPILHQGAIRYVHLYCATRLCFNGNLVHEERLYSVFHFIMQFFFLPHINIFFRSARNKAFLSPTILFLVCCAFFYCQNCDCIFFFFFFLL